MTNSTGKKISAEADMPPERMCTSYCQHCGPLVAALFIVFPTLHTTSPINWMANSTLLPFDALNEGDPLELSGSYVVREN